MVEHKCIKCNKIFKLKGDYTRHINRKFSCVQEIQEVQEVQEVQEIIDVDMIKENIINDLECRYCSKVFSRKDNLNTHISEHCKVKKENDRQKEDIVERLVKEMEEHKKQTEEQKKQVDDLKSEVKKLKKENLKYRKETIGTQNINQQQNIGKQINNTNNINLLAFGKENMAELADELYKRILNKGFKSIPTFIEYLHYDKNKPQNHNLYISNIRNNYVIVYDGSEWQLKERDAILQQIIDEKGEYLSGKFDQLLPELDEHTVRKFNRFLEQRDDKDVILGIKKDLKLLLYNNRKIPEKTKGLLE